MGITDKSAVLAVALTMALVAVAVWAARSRGLFLAGAIAAVVGLIFVPYAHVLWEHDVTERDQIITATFVNLQGTVPGAALGLLVWWRMVRRDPALPTDDRGRR